MSDKPSASNAENAAGTGSPAITSNATASTAAATSAKRPIPEGNPAFRMMGLPRLRLPSRNWLIFLSVSGSIAGAIIYDKWQTRRMKKKWCDVVSPLAEELLSSKMMPRKMTIYLAAPPADGLRTAREHFHDYVKPVLVAAAMDWDVMEGRKEGDVRYKLAERIRRKRKRAGEGEAQEDEEAQGELSVESIRAKNGTIEWDGIGGDLIIGRHTWKEYVRGLHEGWLGPADSPALPEKADQSGVESLPPSSADSGVNDAAVAVAADTGAAITSAAQQPADDPPQEQQNQEPPTSGPSSDEDKKKEEEKPKRRNPPPCIEPQDYASAELSRSTPEIIGPSTAINFPHLLGFRNTPIRIYRFLTRRHLADDVGRQVAAAVLASHRSFNTVAVIDEDSASRSERSVPEQERVLSFEERDWLKTVREPRKEHEESLWLEEMVLDERIASRMRRFELSAEDEDRARDIASGKKEIRRREDGS